MSVHGTSEVTSGREGDDPDGKCTSTNECKDESGDRLQPRTSGKGTYRPARLRWGRPICRQSQHPSGSPIESPVPPLPRRPSVIRSSDQESRRRTSPSSFQPSSDPLHGLSSTSGRTLTRVRTSRPLLESGPVSLLAHPTLILGPVPVPLTVVVRRFYHYVDTDGGMDTGYCCLFTE